MTFSTSRGGPVADVRAHIASDVKTLAEYPINAPAMTTLEKIGETVDAFLGGRSEDMNASVSISGHIDVADTASSYVSLSISASPRPAPASTGNPPGFKSAPGSELQAGNASGALADALVAAQRPLSPPRQPAEDPSGTGGADKPPAEPPAGA